MVFQWNVRWFGTSVVIWNPLEKDFIKRKQVRLKKIPTKCARFYFSSDKRSLASANLKDGIFIWLTKVISEEILKFLFTCFR